MSVRLTLITAMTPNRVIGKDNQLPWRLPNDLKHFREHTEGKIVIMGRKTYESIGKALPKRINLVISRDPEFFPIDASVLRSPEEALAYLERIHRTQTPEAMVIGGAQIYQVFLPLATHLILTEVHAEVEGDAYFPELNTDDWVEDQPAVTHPADERHAYAYTFRFLKRKTR